jgi:hypothetical protein
MTLCRLYPFFVILCAGTGAVLAKCFGVSMLSGVLSGWVVGVGPVLALGIIYVGMMTWRPDLPPCKCGETRYGGFEYIGSYSCGPNETWYENRCPKCGRCYKSRDSIVVELLADGTTVPFMKVSRWGRWEVDRSE